MNDIPAGIAEAPHWSLVAGQFGKGCVYSALIFFILAIVLWLAQMRWSVLTIAAKTAFTLGCVSFFGTFGALASLFANNQFQYDYVFQHGDGATDLKFKIAGIWGGQEGSLLLWACTSSVFALLTVMGTGHYRRWFSIVYSVFLGSVAAILAFDSPFGILAGAVAHGKTYVMPDGAGMTPALQNYWDAIHPPTIFFGFGSLAVFFAYSMAALIERDASDWVQRVRPWVLVSTGILGVGICMGGVWAYETQGWGGFWGWDPVEQASFVPWLFTVILAHGIIVQVARQRWVRTNLFVGGLPFVSFVYGTFLVRSGLLDKASVHSFADMDHSALGILRGFMFATIAAFVIVYCVFVKKAAATVPDGGGEESGVSREGMYRFGMTVLAMLAVVIALGMSWPVMVALRGGVGSKIDEWLYHQVTVWFFIPAMVAMAIGPFVAWKGLGWRALGNRLFTVFSTALGLTGFIQMGLMSPTFGVHPQFGATVAGPFHTHAPLALWMLFLLLLCIFTLVANIWRIGEIVRQSPMSIGGFVAHAGMAILLGGLLLSRGYEQKQEIYVRPGSPDTGLGYTVTFKEDQSVDHPFDRNGKVLFDVRSPDGTTVPISPGHYQYGDPSDPKDMVWPYIVRYPSHDMYFSMLPPQTEAWAQPQAVKPGGKISLGGMTVEYLKATHEGQLGTMGVKFGAQLRVTAQSQDMETHQFLVNPSVQLTENGLIPTMPLIGSDYRIAMLGGMDAADQSVNLMLFFSPPVYPMTIYYKPLTSLIWIGAFTMLSGSLFSALYRRRVVASGDAKAHARSSGGLTTATGWLSSLFR